MTDRILSDQTIESFGIRIQKRARLEGVDLSGAGARKGTVPRTRLTVVVFAADLGKNPGGGYASVHVTEQRTIGTTRQGTGPAGFGGPVASRCKGGAAENAH